MILASYDNLSLLSEELEEQVILGMNIVNDSFHALWSDLSDLRWDVNKAINRFKDLLDKHNLG
jgi:hypothetical protein